MTPDGHASTGRSSALGDVAGHTTALDWLREPGPDRRQGGLRRGRVRCLLGARRPARRSTPRPSGRRSTPAWCRPRPSTARRSSPPRASAQRPTLHPVQQEMAVRGGSQCGYCTPGFVCSMAAEYYRPDAPAASVRPLRPRARPQRLRPARAQRQPVPLHGLPTDPRRGVRARRARRDDALAARPRRRLPPAPTGCAVDGRSSLRPETLAEAFDLLAERPDAQVVAGSTDWGVEVNLRGVAGAPRRRDRPARPSCARSTFGRRRHRDRRRADPHRDRATARRAGAAARASCSRSSRRG